MMSSSKVSAIIVNHNGVEHLDQCLLALTEPGQGIDQILLVDNASTDGSVDHLAATFPEVELIELDDNIGFGAANNLAARRADGDLLLFINSDAWPLDDCMHRLSAAFVRQPGLALTAPQLQYVDGRRQFSWCPPTGVVGEAAQMLRNRMESRAWAHRPIGPLAPGWFSAACILVRKPAFDEIGGFDERFFMYFEDVDLCVRLRRAGWRLELVPRAHAVHVKGGSQSTPVGTSLAYRRSQWLYYQLHRPKWEQWILARRLRHKISRLPGDHELRALLEELH